MSDTTAPVPVTTSAPAPGWRSSEAWISLLVAIVGAIPSTGLIANAPIATKIVGIVAAAFVVLGYTTNRTALKKAHLVAGTPAPAISSAPSALVTAAVAMLFVFGFSIAIVGCTSSQQAALSNGASAGLQCAKQDLNQIVSGTDGKSLLSVVATDVAGGNYLKAIEDLMTTLGGDAVGCAVIAVETVIHATSPIGANAVSAAEQHANELIAKHHWAVAK